jgi:hypothetical protein
MQACTLEITHRDDPTYLEVREGLTLQEATRTQELRERAHFTVASP